MNGTSIASSSMNFSKLRRSRLTALTVATAWLPYMMVCCVVAPLGGASAASPKCHVLAAVLLATAQASGEQQNAEPLNVGAAVSAHDCCAGGTRGERQESGDGVPDRSCCELKDNSNATIEKSVDFAPQPAIVTVALVDRDYAHLKRLVGNLTLTGPRDLGPPLFLRNASFLI